ncbi:hypothetical protein FRB93_013195 [Tulasnella sp. JGI-2019a]|nr:hypothetical protein FRB93_013195 [Tulasnella sp. JGI-2019a]
MKAHESFQRLRKATIDFAYLPEFKAPNKDSEGVGQQIRRFLNFLVERGGEEAGKALKAMEPYTEHHGQSQSSVAKDTVTKGGSSVRKKGASKGKTAALVTGILAVGATGGVAIDRAVDRQDSRVEASSDSEYGPHFLFLP